MAKYTHTLYARFNDTRARAVLIRHSDGHTVYVGGVHAISVLTDVLTMLNAHGLPKPLLVPSVPTTDAVLEALDVEEYANAFKVPRAELTGDVK